MKDKYLKDLETKEFIKKVEENYQNIHDSHDTIKSNNMCLNSGLLALSILEAKGIITREEQEALKRYIVDEEG